MRKKVSIMSYVIFSVIPRCWIPIVRCWIPIAAECFPILIIEFNARNKIRIGYSCCDTHYL